jgi:tetratricopeptide (TPR) repeat protein
MVPCDFALRRLLFVCALACAASSTYAAVADDVRGLLENGRSREAYELGIRNQDRFGDPAFDLPFGMAAVDAGHAGDGVLALERYLLANPGSLNARLELGRGYYLLGEYERAREVFNEVLQRDPPPDVRRKIDQFLAAVSERESAYRSTVRGNIEIGGGHDTNVNSGIGTSVIAVPIFGDVPISAEGQKRADDFALLAGGVQWTMPVARGTALFVGLSGDARGHRRANQFDQAAANLVGGASWTKGDHLLRASLGASALYVDRDRYRDVFAATGEWHGRISGNTAASFFVQEAALRYAGANEVRDAQLHVLGAGLQAALGAGWQSVASISAHIGREANRHDRDDLGRNLYGVRVAVTAVPGERWSAALAATWQESRYLEADLFFIAKRRDRYTAVEGSVGYAFTPALSLRLEGTWIDNKSNIALYQYDRTIGALRLRYDYK